MVDSNRYSSVAISFGDSHMWMVDMDMCPGVTFCRSGNLD